MTNKVEAHPFSIYYEEVGETGNAVYAKRRGGREDIILEIYPHPNELLRLVEEGMLEAQIRLALRRFNPLLGLPQAQLGSEVMQFPLDVVSLIPLIETAGEGSILTIVDLLRLEDMKEEDIRKAFISWRQEGLVKIRNLLEKGATTLGGEESDDENEWCRWIGYDEAENEILRSHHLLELMLLFSTLKLTISSICARNNNIHLENEDLKKRVGRLALLFPWVVNPLIRGFRWTEDIKYGELSMKEVRVFGSPTGLSMEILKVPLILDEKGVKADPNNWFFRMVKQYLEGGGIEPVVVGLLDDYRFPTVIPKEEGLVAFIDRIRITLDFIFRGREVTTVLTNDNLIDIWYPRSGRSPDLLQERIIIEELIRALVNNCPLFAAGSLKASSFFTVLP